MDTAARAGSTTKDTATDIGDSIQRAPAQIRRKTQGSPLALGLMAFGAGLLAAALLPSTKAEALEAVKSTAQDAALVTPAAVP
ncbi:hypothetical protein ACWEQL_24440 [Kitasatospora sp. NPDC004240]